MKSYDVCEWGAPMQLMERPTPKPIGSEVLLRVLAAGVCHSDLHIWDGYYDLGGGKRLKLSDRGRETAADDGPRKRRRSRRRRPRRCGRQGWRRATGLSLAWLRHLRGLPAGRRESLSRPIQHWSISRGAATPTICWSLIRAISSISAAFRPSCAAPLGLLRHYHLQRAEEGRPPSGGRADRRCRVPAGWA